MNKKKSDSKNGIKIIEEKGRRLLTVSSLQDLKIVSSPQRQRIFKLLQTSEKPLHGKEIADSLGIKAPSSHYHLRKLEEIGAVRISHTQIINGITATYYAPAVDVIMTGEDFLSSSDDEQISNKLLFTANVFNEAKKAFIESLGERLRQDEQSPDSVALSMLLNTTLYFQEDEIDSFSSELNALIEKYSDSSPDKQGYSILLSISGPDSL